MIIDYIPTGSLNAITAKELQLKAGYKSTREVTKEIHKLRSSGVVICSQTDEPAGYFLPENKYDVAMFCNQMRSRVMNIGKAVESAEKLLEEYDRA